MRKYGLRILVGLVAFGIGLSAVIVWFLYQPICDCVDYRNEKPLIINSDLAKSGKTEFVFKRFTQDDNNKRAEFVLINGTDKEVFYSGYINIDNSYCVVDYKQKGKIKMSPACCGTGLVTKTLKSGEEKVFTVFLFDWKDVNQVGFKTFDENNKSFVVWSDKFG